tara:strand:- start:1831 stop:2007 length:177 start_codon:yes stop_codon:yes gene_type:complete
MKDKKYTTDQRIKRVEKAIGELYVMIHHIANKIEPEEKPKNDMSDIDGNLNDDNLLSY